MHTDSVVRFRFRFRFRSIQVTLAHRLSVQGPLLEGSDREFVNFDYARHFARQFARHFPWQTGPDGHTIELRLEDSA